MFDPYHKWLGIPLKEQPPHHYRLLGVDLFESDLDVIEGAADKQMAFVRQYQSGEHANEAARVLNELAMARLCLLKAPKKAEYDAKLKKKLAVPAKPNPEDSFADMDLPEIPSNAIVELPKRKRKPKKSNWPKISPNVIKLVLGGIIGLMWVPYLSKYLKDISQNNLALAPVAQPEQAGAPQPTPAAIVQVDATAPAPDAKSPQQSTIRSSSQVTSELNPGSPSSSSPQMPASQEVAISDRMDRRPTPPPPPPPRNNPGGPMRPPIGNLKPPMDPADSSAFAEEMVGGAGGFPKSIELDGKTMIGVDWAQGEWAGMRAFSKLIPVSEGTPNVRGLTRVTAPKGYAVGAVKVYATQFVHGMQLIYMKVNEDGSLDTSNTKQSKWLGLTPKVEATTLSGEGKRLVGFQYRAAIVVDAIGILVEPE